MGFHIASSASISESAQISLGVYIWNYSQIREQVIIGENSIIGSYVYIDANVIIGNNCKIQNRALIYSAARISDNVFIGPGVILTNDRYPIAATPTGAIKSAEDWEKVSVIVKEGASIGSGAICIAPVTIGKFSMIGAGAVVTRDIPDYGLFVGNPARQIGWVGPNGTRLVEVKPNIFKCPQTSSKFLLENQSLTEMINP